MLFREIGTEGCFEINRGNCDTEVGKNTEVVLICGSTSTDSADSDDLDDSDVLYNSDDEVAEKYVVRWLSPEEQRRYQSFGVEKRKRQYLLGRIAAKIAIKKLLSRNFGILGIRAVTTPLILENREKEVVILNDDNGSPRIADIPDIPAVRSDSEEGWLSKKLNVSISHSGCLAAAIAFSEKFSCGIDVEAVNPAKIRALQRVLVPGEPFCGEYSKHDAERNCSQDTLQNCSEESGDAREGWTANLTIAWSLKEALSKALGTGFGESFEKLRIKECCYSSESGVYAAKYAHFPEYRGESRVMETKAEIRSNIKEQIINKFVVSLAIKKVNENLLTDRSQRD